MRPTEAEQSMRVHNVAMTNILAMLICMKVRPYTCMPNIRGSTLALSAQRHHMHAK